MKSKKIVFNRYNNLIKLLMFQQESLSGLDESTDEYFLAEIAIMLTLSRMSELEAVLNIYKYNDEK